LNEYRVTLRYWADVDTFVVHDAECHHLRRATAVRPFQADTLDDCRELVCDELDADPFWAGSGVVVICKLCARRESASTGAVRLLSERTR
jgi:hypothetical protein